MKSTSPVGRGSFTRTARTKPPRQCTSTGWLNCRSTSRRKLSQGSWIRLGIREMLRLEIRQEIPVFRFRRAVGSQPLAHAFAHLARPIGVLSRKARVVEHLLQLLELIPSALE